MLREPISYHTSVPEYILFVSFGALSGHSLAKAVGPVGSHYSRNSTLDDPWREITREKFDKLSQCLVDHYSQYSIDGPNGKHSEQKW